MATLASSLTGRSQRCRFTYLVALYRRCAAPLAHVVFFASLTPGGVRGATVPTEDLIRRFQRGQPRAFEMIYERYKDYVYRTALFVTRNASDAEEAVQETFLDVLRALPRYRVEGPARFETWLYRVTVNRCRSRARRKALPSVDWEDVEERLERIPASHPNHDPESAFARRERAVKLWRTVDELPDAHRLVILLRYQQEFSYEEIAETLGISEGTVKSRLYYAHRKLREQLEMSEDALSPGETGG